MRNSNDHEIRYNDVRRGLVKAGDILKRDDPDSSSFDAFLDLLSDLSNVDADFVQDPGSGVTQSSRQLETPRGQPRFEPPDWYGLLERLFNLRVSGHPSLRQKYLTIWCKRYGLASATSVRDLFGHVDRLQMAWLIGQIFPDRSALEQAIRSIVQPLGQPDSELIRQLRRLPTSVVVTTSYDNVVETMFSQTSPAHAEIGQHDYRKKHLNNVIPIYNVRSLSDSFRLHGLKLVYLHGSANRAASELVLDRFGYASLLSQPVGGLFDHVTHLLRGLPAIYIGTGLDDPSFTWMENRLFSYDSVARPMSYAFVPVATPEEHSWWRSRNLRLIEYGDHSSLHTLIEIAVNTRRFVCWAEPERPIGSNREADRTDRYFDDFLDSYRRGDYSTATRFARAALASTVFWGTLQNAEQVDRESIAEILRVIDIRIRLGISHYKRRTADRQAMERATVNGDAAELLLQSLKMREREFTDDNRREFTALQCSLAVLKARMNYSEGAHAQAGQIYQSVTKALAPVAEEATSRPLDYIALNSVAIYAYARCQASRITYQAARDSAWKNETLELDKLATLLSTVSAQMAPDLALKSSVRRHFEHAFGTLRYIARSFAGRHCVGAIDVLPSPSELLEPTLAMQLSAPIDEAIGYLDSDSDANSEQVLPARWTSLRARYLARAYALRWLLNGGQGDELARAYTVILQAIELVAKPELQRSRIVTHLEAARVALIAAYGAVVCRGGGAQSDPSFALLSSMEHLRLALWALQHRADGGGDSALRKDRFFLVALVGRLRAYAWLLMDIAQVDSGGIRQIPTLREGVDPSDAAVVEWRNSFSSPEDFDRYGLGEVVGLYLKFDPLGTRPRIERFLRHFEQIRRELVDPPDQPSAST